MTGGRGGGGGGSGWLAAWAVGFWAGRLAGVRSCWLVGWLAGWRTVFAGPLTSRHQPATLKSHPACLPGCRMAVEKLKEGIDNFAGGWAGGWVGGWMDGLPSCGSENGDDACLPANPPPGVTAVSSAALCPLPCCCLPAVLPACSRPGQTGGNDCPCTGQAGQEVRGSVPHRQLQVQPQWLQPWCALHTTQMHVPQTRPPKPTNAPPSVTPLC